MYVGVGVGAFQLPGNLVYDLWYIAQMNCVGNNSTKNAESPQIDIFLEMFEIFFGVYIQFSARRYNIPFNVTAMFLCIQRKL